jgi:hypothetical protein
MRPNRIQVFSNLFNWTSPESLQFSAQGLIQSLHGLFLVEVVGMKLREEEQGARRQ